MDDGNEYRPQDAKVRQGLVEKKLVMGVMASRGRWSAWGADQAQAAEALYRMLAARR